MAWADLQPGHRVRFTTPSFVKRGLLVAKNKRSLKIRFDGEKRDTILPNGTMYWVDHKCGRQDYGLCRIEGKSPPPAPARRASHEAEWMRASDAARDHGITPKQLRVWLRAGKIKAGRSKKTGEWMVDRVSLGRFLAER